MFKRLIIKLVLSLWAIFSGVGSLYSAPLTYGPSSLVDTLLLSLDPDRNGSVVGESWLVGEVSSYYLSKFANFNEFVSYLNDLGEDCVGVIDTSMTLLADSSLNSKVKLLPTPGNEISPGAYNLIVRKLASTGDFKWINKTGIGNVFFEDGATDYVSPHWWSGVENGSDITVGLQGAFDSMPGAHIKIMPGVYEWSGTITNTVANNRGGYIFEGAHYSPLLRLHSHKHSTWANRT